MSEGVWMESECVGRCINTKSFSNNVYIGHDSSDIAFFTVPSNTENRLCLGGVWMVSVGVMRCLNRI